MLAQAKLSLIKLLIIGPFEIEIYVFSSSPLWQLFWNQCLHSFKEPVSIMKICGWITLLFGFIAEYISPAIFKSLEDLEYISDFVPRNLIKSSASKYKIKMQLLIRYWGGYIYLTDPTVLLATTIEVSLMQLIPQRSVDPLHWDVSLLLFSKIILFFLFCRFPLDLAYRLPKLNLNMVTCAFF